MNLEHVINLSSGRSTCGFVLVMEFGPLGKIAGDPPGLDKGIVSLSSPIWSLRVSYPPTPREQGNKTARKLKEPHGKVGDEKSASSVKGQKVPCQLATICTWRKTN